MRSGKPRERTAVHGVAPDGRREQHPLGRVDAAHVGPHVAAVRLPNDGCRRLAELVAGAAADEDGAYLAPRDVTSRQSVLSNERGPVAGRTYARGPLAPERCRGLSVS